MVETETEDMAAAQRMEMRTGPTTEKEGEIGKSAFLVDRRRVAEWQSDCIWKSDCFLTTALAKWADRA